MHAGARIVFDLDDTLYLERDFARSGYRAAERVLGESPASHGFADLCLELLDAGERCRIFDTALQRSGLAPDPTLITRLVEAYRSHAPDIQLAADAARYFARHPSCVKNALITDGLAPTQEAKIVALGLHTKLGCIVCTGRLGPQFGKPHPRAFQTVERWAGPSKPRLVYVADNPLKDFVTPKAHGWRTVQINRPERVHRHCARDRHHEADAIIESFDELDACLDEFVGGP